MRVFWEEQKGEEQYGTCMYVPIGNVSVHVTDNTQKCTDNLSPRCWFDEIMRFSNWHYTINAFSAVLQYVMVLCVGLSLNIQQLSWKQSWKRRKRVTSIHAVQCSVSSSVCLNLSQTWMLRNRGTNDYRWRYASMCASILSYVGCAIDSLLYFLYWVLLLVYWLLERRQMEE